MNFFQLKWDLKQDEKRQNVLEELHDYFILKELIGPLKIQEMF